MNAETKPGPTVTPTDMSIIPATQQGQLPLKPKLSIHAKKAAVLNDFHISSLILFGQIYDDNCKVILDNSHCYVIKDEDLILQGKRNLKDSLWDIKLPVQNKSISP